MSAVAALSAAQPERLPWPSAPLLELCDFLNGLWTGKKGPFETVNVIRNTNFTADGRIDLTDVAVLDVEVRQFARRGLQKNDVIIEKSGGGPKQPVGRVVLFDLAEKNYSFSNFTSAIRVKKGVKLDPVFLHRVLYWWYVSGRTEPLQRRSTGIRNLDFNAYKELEVPLPPLDEQKRIVALLDQAFAALARARAHAEANLADAEELFESQRMALLAEAARGAPVKVLGSISSRVSVGHVGETSKYYVEDDGIPFIRSQNVRPAGLDVAAVRQITRAFHAQLKKSQLVGGELLFVRVGANRSDCCKVPMDCGEMNCANIVFARPTEGNLSYLEQFCQSRVGRALLLGMTTGSAQGVINTKSVATLPIPFPTVDSQNRVVEKIEGLKAGQERLSEIYRVNISCIANLRQSLLQKAFSGELT